MSEVKHTPGPWKVHGDIFVQGSDGEFIFGGVSTQRDDDECEANVRLIAAAPELLEALQKLCAVDDITSWAPQWDAARAAIAKATGSAT